MGEGGRKKREKEMERVTKKYLFMVVFANALSKRLSAHSDYEQSFDKVRSWQFLSAARKRSDKKIVEIFAFERPYGM